MLGLNSNLDSQMSNSHELPAKQLTTFRTPVQALNISVARWPREFLTAYARAQANNQGFIILGQGSNVLFVEDFQGEIVLNNYKGISVQCTPEHYILSVNSGVTIEELIDYCHRFKIYGLENLTLIPSSIGTAAISNIGAYGVEFESFVERVTLLDLNTGETLDLSHQECKFSYRNSIFKYDYRDGYAVINVTLKLPRIYKPILTYAPLNTLDPQQATPQLVRQMVRETRMNKLPNYNQTGNGGSFFMNPIVPMAKFLELKERFPKIVSYPIDETQVKLSAGWLIDNAGLKGFAFERSQVSPTHALILINSAQQATGFEIARLASKVVAQVQELYGITLIPEIRFIARHGEVNAPKLLAVLEAQDYQAPINYQVNTDILSPDLQFPLTEEILLQCKLN